MFNNRKDTQYPGDKCHLSQIMINLYGTLVANHIVAASILMIISNRVMITDVIFNSFQRKFSVGEFPVRIMPDRFST